MKLVSIYRIRAAPTILYQLLVERMGWDNVNISHRKMPTYRRHKTFIRSRPYAHWYLIKIDNEYVGSIYLTWADEIGVFLFPESWGRGYGEAAIRELMRKHPRERFLANINPRNGTSIRLFRRLGFTLLQNTYERRA